MTSHVPHYYSTGSEIPGQLTLVHVLADGSIRTMQYDNEVPVGTAIKMMQQQERVYKHFGNENAANRKKFN